MGRGCGYVSASACATHNISGVLTVKGRDGRALKGWGKGRGRGSGAGLVMGRC